MPFTKYETRGAYHWREISRRVPYRYSARLHALYDWYVKETRARRPDFVVDVGCGDAALTHLLATGSVARVIGVEPDPTGFRLATAVLEERKSRATVIHGTGERLPFEDGQVSLVVMCEVIEHVAEGSELVAEAARVLAADGTLLLSTPQWQSPELRPQHVREYTAAELGSVCGAYFTEVRVLVAEPPWLYDRYVGSRWWRALINTASAAGLNPFSRRRDASVGTEGWRQLLAIASAPRRSESGA